MSVGTIEVRFTTSGGEDVEATIDRINQKSVEMAANAAMAGTTGTTNWSRFGTTLGHVGVMGVIAMDRLQISQIAVENAQERATLAQERYTAAVEKYGAGSAQARRAQQEFEISTRAVDIALQREQVRMLVMGGVVIPQMIAGVYRMIGTLGHYTAATGVATIGTVALTNAMRALLATSIIGIPFLVAGLALSAGVGGGDQNFNHYGDINVQGGGPMGYSPAGYAQAVRPSGG